MIHLELFDIVQFMVQGSHHFKHAWRLGNFDALLILIFLLCFGGIAMVPIFF